MNDGSLKSERVCIGTRVDGSELVSAFYIYTFTSVAVTLYSIRS